MLAHVDALERFIGRIQSVDGYPSLELSTIYIDRSLASNVQEALKSIEQLKAIIRSSAQIREKLFVYAQEICSALATDTLPDLQKRDVTQPLESLGFRPAIIRKMKEQGVHTVEDLLSKSWSYLWRIPGFGKRKVEEVEQVLASHGFYLKKH